MSAWCRHSHFAVWRWDQLHRRAVFKRSFDIIDSQFFLQAGSLPVSHFGSVGATPTPPSCYHASDKSYRTTQHPRQRHSELKAYIMGLIKPSISHRSIDGTELLSRRESAGLTQTELAKRCNVSQGFISQIERPGTRDIGTALAESFIRIFGESGENEDK